MRETRQMGNTTGRRVGIIGGSIAGCATAVALQRAGWEVTLFERAGGELQERGAGIVIFSDALQRFVDMDLLDVDLPRCRVASYQESWRTTDQARLGRRCGVHPVKTNALHWGDLYRSLRARVPDGAYRYGSEVAALRQDGRGAVVALADGSEFDFDLVVAADGYQSIGRRTLFPELSPEYAGYIAWRGVLQEASAGDVSFLQDTVCSPGFNGGQGIFYFLPGDGSDRPGERQVNWLIYLALEPRELPAFLVDRHGRCNSGTVPPGTMRDAQVAELNALMRAGLPTAFADICERSRDSFVQAIFETDVPAYARGRICLVGDAAALASPKAGRGALKAMDDALALGRALASADDIDSRLQAWSRTQCAQGNRCYRLGRRSAQAMILDGVDWSSMDEAAFGRWFLAANTLDED